MRNMGTKLSNYIWRLKCEGKSIRIGWGIIEKGSGALKSVQAM